MNKILGILLGILAIVGGCALVMIWFDSVVLLLKASVPALLIFGGVIAVFSGVSEWRDTIKFGKS